MAKATNIMDSFFKLGDKATKGDPVRMADFNYYMLWLMFLAFFSIMLTSIFTGIAAFKISVYQGLRNIAWAGVMCAILWFQYSALKSQREARRNLKEVYKNLNKGEKPKPLEEESVEEMMSQFKDKKE